MATTNVLSIPAVPLDRRRLVALVLAGAGGVLLAEAGVMRPYVEGPALALASVERSLAALGARYDAVPATKAATALRATERSLAAVFGSRPLPAQTREAKALYGRVLTMSAVTANRLGDHRDAIRTAELAASLAIETGDTQTAARGWAAASNGLAKIGRHRTALDIARRAQTTAPRSPAAVAALVEAEAHAAGRQGQAAVVLDAVTAAETTHARLGDGTWGPPEGFLPGAYHPAWLKLHSGFSLTRVGLYGEARARLDEAAGLVAGTDAAGLRSWIWLGQARAALGTGDVDTAHGYAGLAVAEADSRPTAPIADAVRELEAVRPGAFRDLVALVDVWSVTGR